MSFMMLLAGSQFEEAKIMNDESILPSTAALTIADCEYGKDKDKPVSQHRNNE